MTREEITHYEVLGVPRSANSAEIWEAHRDRLAEADSDAEIEKIEKAYAVLSNRDFRIRYDTDLHIRERMRSGSASPPPSTEAKVTPSDKPIPGRYPSRSLPPSSYSRKEPARIPGLRRFPNTALGWVVLITIFAIRFLIRSDILDSNNNDSNALDMSIFGGTPSAEVQESRELVEGILESRQNDPSVYIPDWEREYVIVDENGRVVYSYTIGSDGYQFQRPDSVANEESYYERGLRQLPESTEPNDRAEQMAVSSFIQATLIDSSDESSYLRLGEIYFFRWQANRSDSNQEHAQRYLNRYDALVIGSPGSQVEAMLDALAGNTDIEVVRPTLAPPLSQLSTDIDPSQYGFEEVDARTYYELAMSYLVEHRTQNDPTEQLAIMMLTNAIHADDEFRPAFRLLGEIYFERWQVDGSADNRRLALENLSRYKLLRNGSIDEQVLGMFEALSSDANGVIIQSTLAPPLPELNTDLDLSQLGFEEVNAELYYAVGMDYLATSFEPYDPAEILGVLMLTSATNRDRKFGPAFGALGAVYYTRWQADGDADNRRLALENLSHYKELRNGSIDEWTQSMLDALMGDANGVIIQPAVAPDEANAEAEYELGLDYLAQSTETGDAREIQAESQFRQVILLEPDHQLAHRNLGEIYFDRWQENESERIRLLALQHLNRYESLTDGPSDSKVQAMLDSLE